MSRTQAFRSSVFIMAAGLACLPLTAMAQELFSESVDVRPAVSYVYPSPQNASPISVNGWDKFTILTWGTPLLPTQDATDTNSDPFAVTGNSTITQGGYLPLATDVGDALGPGPITIAGLNHITFSGQPITTGNIQGIDNPSNQVQFGLVGPADNTVMHFLGQHWSNTSSLAALPTPIAYLSSTPIVSVTPHPAPPPASSTSAASFEYIIDYIQFMQNGITGSEWVEFPFLPGQQPTFTYSGWATPVASQLIHFTENYIQVSPTMIPLDDLNFADDPPPIVDPLPGAPALPAFTAQADPDDIVAAVPEPAILGVSLLAAIGIVRRRK